MSTLSSNPMGSGKSPVRVGLIGCGNIWRLVYRPVMATLAGRATLAALCDLSTSAAEEAAAQFPEARRYADPESLLCDKSLDVVLVLTTEKANAPTALKALQAGFAVFMEKPPAMAMAEWRTLTEAAEAAGNRLYTGFNRRHTPLFKNWSLPENARLRSVKGVLLRQRRGLAHFPTTAVHVIDSAQFFAGRLLTEARPVLEEGKNGLFWKIHGRLEGGAVCELTIEPDGPDHREHLIFETDDQIWELHFPLGKDSEHPGGMLVSRSASSEPGNYSAAQVIKGDPEDDPLYAAGHMASFPDFIQKFEEGSWQTSPHQIRRCGPTIALMEEMLQQGEAAVGT